MATLGETFVTKSYDKKGRGMKAHPGFKAVQKKVAKSAGISMERAGAVVAAGARKASKKAVAKNPRLKKVSGVVEKKTGEKYASKGAMKKHEKSEGKSERMKEYGKGGRRGR